MSLLAENAELDLAELVCKLNVMHWYHIGNMAYFFVFL